MPKYTLHYFGGNGRAVIARALLCYVKADWTNDLIKREDWPKLKQVVYVNMNKFQSWK